MKPLDPQDARLRTDSASIQNNVSAHILYSIGKSERAATARDRYEALALSVRDHLVARWMQTQSRYYETGAKRVYYLSLEFLMGRTLRNALVNLGLLDEYKGALDELGVSFDELEELESDAGLGNGGLGRLAACFLDSMATLGVPGFGYGIRYDYGVFRQNIVDGWQREDADDWLRLPNPWEIVRPEHFFVVQFGGRCEAVGGGAEVRYALRDSLDVLATAHDTPIPGYGNDTVNTLRLWQATGTRELNFDDFNAGDYVGAVQHMVLSRTISRVLYPNDSFYLGQELRLKQQYFSVSASLQDALRRHLVDHENLDNLPDKAVFQLNDTHPSLAIPEMMRLLIDVHGYDWHNAWAITTQCMAYTNHTLLPEALEKWPEDLIGRMLPRHLMIIQRINYDFLDDIRRRFPGHEDLVRRLSIYDEQGSQRRLRMANLATIGAFSVNGVAAIHTELLKSRVLADFNRVMPEKFNNKTNGVTPRRWLLSSNPGLASIITDCIGNEWPRDLDKLVELNAYADDATFQETVGAAKRASKVTLSNELKWRFNFDLDPDAVYDIHIKRIHEYKRQLLNILHVVHLYSELQAQPNLLRTPRVFLFAGKAAPAYHRAKLIIKLINAVGERVNNHPEVSKWLRVYFVPDYSVTKAELMVPAADISEQISTAGYEASGTGNMKLMLNGAVTLGTLDGANVEIAEAVGPENIFIFGLTVDELQAQRSRGYHPEHLYQHDLNLRRVIDLVAHDHFAPSEPGIFQSLVESLLTDDFFMCLADFNAYREAQVETDIAYADPRRFRAMAIRNIAQSGRFSSDRTIRDYCRDIWNVPVGP